MPSARSDSSAASGFTLVEVMLAVLILSILMSLAYGIVLSTVKANERIEDISQSSEIGPAILSIVRRDLESAFVSDPRAEEFVAVDRKAGNGDRDRVDFIAATMSYGDEREGGEAPLFHSVNEVGYQLVDSREESGVGVLYRREDLFVDREPLRGGRLSELHARVQSFNLSFWDGQDWRPEWNSKLMEGKLPQAIRVELTLLAREGEQKDVERRFATTITFPR
jgi:type II secretion system protein J